MISKTLWQQADTYWLGLCWWYSQSSFALCIMESIFIVPLHKSTFEGLNKTKPNGQVIWVVLHTAISDQCTQSLKKWVCHAWLYWFNSVSEKETSLFVRIINFSCQSYLLDWSLGELWPWLKHGSDAWCQNRSDTKLKCNAWLLVPYELNSPFLKLPLQHFWQTWCSRGCPTNSLVTD